jgi:hypothetical protein
MDQATKTPVSNKTTRLRILYALLVVGIVVVIVGVVLLFMNK